jgi:hypothetical protein
MFSGKNSPCFSVVLASSRPRSTSDPTSCVVPADTCRTIPTGKNGSKTTEAFRAGWNKKWKNYGITMIYLQKWFKGLIGKIT